jgi:hypothetical protein
MYHIPHNNRTIALSLQKQAAALHNRAMASTRSEILAPAHFRSAYSTTWHPSHVDTEDTVLGL